MFSDCTGLTIQVPSGEEPGARGVAILAGVACGVYKDIADAIRSVIQIERVHHPNPDATRKYQRIYPLYQQIYQDNQRSWWDRHNMMQGFPES